MTPDNRRQRSLNHFSYSLVRPLAMRTLVIAITVLLLQLVAIGNALACRGPFQPTSDIVNASSSIFTARVISRAQASEREHVVELRVTGVLKGSVPESLTVNGNALLHPNDNCLAIESGEPFPHVDTGEEWLVSGNFDANRNFVPTTGGSFRLAYPDGTATQGRNRVLSEFRKTVSRMLKKSKNIGQ